MQAKHSTYEGDCELLDISSEGTGAVGKGGTAESRTAPLGSAATSRGDAATVLPPPTFTWSVSTLTQPSQSFYAASVNRHQSRAMLSEAIASSAERALSAAERCTVTSQGSMTYEGFVSGLLGSGEYLVVPMASCVAFDGATLASAKDIANLKPLHRLKRGLVVLTNKRLLLLSASASVSNEVAAIPWRKVKDKDEGYEVKCTVGDSKEFFPIDLSAVKTFRFTMSVNSTASFHVESQAEECCCCVCSKKWLTHSPEPSLSMQHKREIVVCLDLPPWSERAMLTIYVASTMMLETIKGFVFQLQSLIEPVTQQPR